MIATYRAAAAFHDDHADREELASRFAFTSRPVAAPDADRGRALRHVHPDYRNVDAWISSVGAGVAVATSMETASITTCAWSIRAASTP